MARLHAEALAKIAATGLAGVFAGAATFISVAQHPALLETDELAFQAPFFRRMYFYAARMQGPMAVGSGLSALAVYFLQRERQAAQMVTVTAATFAFGLNSPRLWLASGCMMIAITPFTVVKMLAINFQLVNPKVCRSRGKSWLQRTLTKWGKLHNVRTGASLLAFTGMVVAMAYSGGHEQQQYYQQQLQANSLFVSLRKEDRRISRFKLPQVSSTPPFSPYRITSSQVDRAAAVSEKGHHSFEFPPKVRTRKADHFLIAKLTKSSRQHTAEPPRKSMWLPSVLFHWRRLLLQQTRKVLLFVPTVVGKDRTLSLVDLADEYTRVVLTHVPVAGRAMLTTYNEWIVDAIETAEQEQQQQVEQPAVAESPMPLVVQPGTEGSRSLHAVCEYYMYRNDGLQHVNRSLVHQISKLEGDLKQAQTSLFQAQCIIARLKEIEDLRCQRIRESEGVYVALRQVNPLLFREVRLTSGAQARRMITVEPDASANTTDGEDSDAGSDREDVDDQESLDDVTSTESSSDEVHDEVHANADGDHHQLSAVNRINPRQDAAQGQLTTSPTSSSISYSDLVELNAPEESERDTSNWHRQALRRLVQEREQRCRARSQSQSQTSSPRLRSRVSFASSVDMEIRNSNSDNEENEEEEPEEPLNFQALVALRTSDDDHMTADWQRRVLQRLSRERERLPRCHRFSNASSTSPTNSSTSTLTFAYDD